MHVFDKSADRRRAAMDELLPMLVSGTIRPTISKRMSLKDARQAHELFDSGKILGKLLLKP
jgi:NADPH:quinone reductase-like Zn-dependent oxidoreductase